MGRRLCDFRHDYPAMIAQFETVWQRTTESVKPATDAWEGPVQPPAIILR